MRTLEERPVRVYSADTANGGLAASLGKAANELWGGREIIWRLFVRDFISQFRQRMLGYAWACLTPLVGIASFVLLNYAGVLRPGELSIPYPIFVYLGTSVWGLMVGAVSVVSGALLTHGDLILRTSIPKMALAISSVASLVYTQAVNLVVLLGVLIVYGVTPSWGALLFPIMLVPMMLLGVGIGLFLAVTGTIARDVTSIATTLLGLAMYITPVVFAPTVPNRLLQVAVTYNPLTYLVDEPRNMFIRGQIEHPLAFASAVIFGLVVLTAGVHVFYLIQDKVAERL
jgi:ABC-type polysaccharide/polyol phosphate export permease